MQTPNKSVYPICWLKRAREEAKPRDNKPRHPPPSGANRCLPYRYLPLEQFIYEHNSSDDFETPPRRRSSARKTEKKARVRDCRTATPTTSARLDKTEDACGDSDSDSEAPTCEMDTDSLERKRELEEELHALSVRCARLREQRCSTREGVTTVELDAE